MELKSLIEVGLQIKKLLEKKFDSILTKYELRQVEADILVCLASKSVEDTAKSISEGLHLSKSHVSKSLDNLKKKKFIQMVEDADDRRVLHIVLNRKSLELVREMKAVTEECTNLVMDGITDDEKRALMGVFEKTKINISKEFGNK